MGPKKISAKKLDSIQDPIFKSVVSIPPNERLHDWELPITETTKLFHRPQMALRIAKYISPPDPSMLTVQGIMSNYYYNNAELFNICEPIGIIKRIKSGTNKPKTQAGFKYNKLDDDVRGFDSQITLWVDQQPFNGESGSVFKVKLFNGVNGIGKIQIPGIKNINETIDIIRYLRDFINKQNFIHNNMDLLEPLMPKKFIDIIYSCIKPIIDEPVAENVYEFGYSRKCVLRVPAGKLINFNKLNEVINDTYNQQRLNNQENIVENFKYTQMFNSLLPIGKQLSKNIMQLIYKKLNRNPLYDIVWPISGPAEDNKGQRKCTVLIFNPRHGNDEKKYSTIVFNSVPKDRGGNIITASSTSDVWEYSILLTGSADERHINYIYRFVWEFLNFYQDTIFYDNDDNIYTDHNIKLYRKIIELEQQIYV
jgi:hypothetical protein